MARHTVVTMPGDGIGKAMLMDHVGEEGKAKAVRDAVAAVVQEGQVRTYDRLLTCSASPATPTCGSTARPRRPR